MWCGRAHGKERYRRQGDSVISLLPGRLASLIEVAIYWVEELCSGDVYLHGRIVVANYLEDRTVWLVCNLILDEPKGDVETFR